MRKLSCRQIYSWQVLVAFLILTAPFHGCGEEGTDESFAAGFSYSFIDDNNVRFTNESEGEYWKLNWNFGNGQTESTTSKTESFDIYYPMAGDYEVTLGVNSLEGEHKSVLKTVAITKTDFAIDFTAEIDTENPNYVALKNASVGNYDSFKWLYRSRTVENKSNLVAYFPYSGTFDIELQVEKDGKTYSKEQTITIAQNDPDYLLKMELVWSDEFDGNAVNTGNWTFETGAGGWGNNELQNYTNGDNVKVEDGILTIIAKKIDENKVAGSYTSTRLISKGKEEFAYGKMEIRAKLPAGTGVWPAIWMLGTNINTAGWPACGEIDIMEYVGYQPNKVHATVHTTVGSGSNGSGSSKTLSTAEEEYHIYGLIWTEKELIFYTDTPKNVTHKYSPFSKNDDNWPFNKPHFFILNVAVGGNWGGAQGVDNAIFPQSMEVDYVRVYQEK